MKNRNIALCIIFSIITFGIYGIYWFICLTNEMNMATPDDTYQTSGGMAFLFSLLTCGIYSFYWNYRMGQKIDSVKNGSNAVLFLSSLTVLFLILSIFGLGIVNYCIAQSFINDQAA